MKIWRSCRYSTRWIWRPHRPDEAKEEIEDVIGLDASDAPLISAKEGIGIEELLEDIVNDISRHPAEMRTAS